MTEVLVSKTFLESTGKLAAKDRGRALDFMSKFSTNPASPGLHLERQLLYVSVTRARDRASITWSGTPSRFLAALRREAIGG